jgi:hypothetical protein
METGVVLEGDLFLTLSGRSCVGKKSHQGPSDGIYDFDFGICPDKIRKA